MNRSQKNALILGASGLTGQYCLTALLESNCYKHVIALVRHKMDITHEKLTQEVVDFDLTAPLEHLYEGVDDVFCCLGTTIKNAGSEKAFRRVDFHIPSESANIASQHGVSQFLAISSVGANNKSSNFYLKVKGELEKGIEQFSFEAIHIFRPSLLLGDRIEERKGEAIAKFLSKLFSPILSGSKSKYEPIKASVVAKAMVNAAQLSSKGNNYYSSNQIKRLAQKANLCPETE